MRWPVRFQVPNPHKLRCTNDCMERSGMHCAVRWGTRTDVISHVASLISPIESEKSEIKKPTIHDEQRLTEIRLQQKYSGAEYGHA